MSTVSFLCFFFNDTPTTEIYTLSLHDALPISAGRPWGSVADSITLLGRRPDPIMIRGNDTAVIRGCIQPRRTRDRKSTRLNSSHANISYAVFCLQKK